MSTITIPHHATLAEEFDRLGVIHVPAVFTPDEVAEIREAFMAQVERDSSIGHDDNVPESDPLAKYPRFVHPHRRTDLEVGRISRKWMLDERILDRVTAMMGPVYAAQSMFYFKPTGARGQAMHQDNLFLQAHPETCIAAWIAVDDCDGENGGLKMVPGSHRYELVCPEDADADESFTNAEVKLPEGMVAEQTVLAAGDMLFFHGSMVHGSGPNRSADRFRRSLIFHYIPQSSIEIATFYNPLLTPAGDEITVSESEDGGACGEGWTPAGPH